MKAVILAGGLGTRISEETHLKPKPMIEIGGKPILWHIMKIYSYYGVNDFIICCGYKGYIIKEYFANYLFHMSDVTFNLKDNKTIIHKKSNEPWNVSLIDTGEKSMTGGRLTKIKSYLDDDKPFFLTYGDGLSNINISDLFKFHKKTKKQVTLTTVNPPSRFGSLNFSKDNETVKTFSEKTEGGNIWINGGFFVVEPSVLNLIKNQNTVWETEIISLLVKNKQLSAFKHNGFWAPMDTIRDKNYLNSLWESSQAPWKLW